MEAGINAGLHGSQHLMKGSWLIILAIITLVVSLYSSVSTRSMVS
jgi:hypothetical protein